MREPRNKLISLATLGLVALCALSATAGAQRPLAIGGTIPNPTGKSGTVVAWLSHLGASANGVIAFGEVTAAGDFSMELPAKLVGDALQSIEMKKLCIAGGQEMQLSTSAAEHALVSTVAAFDMTKTPVSAVLANSADMVARLEASKADVRPGDALGYYLYASQNVTIRGSCMSPDGLPVTYDVAATAGWNRVVYAIEAEGEGVHAVMRSVRDFPADMAWVPVGQ